MLIKDRETLLTSSTSRDHWTIYERRILLKACRDVSIVQSA